MIAQIIERPPFAGCIEESIFCPCKSCAESLVCLSGTCAWIRFSNEKEIWAGVFNHFGSPGGVEAAVFNADKHAFVIAGSEGYLVNLKNRSLIANIQGSSLKKVLALPGRDGVIMTSMGGSVLLECDSSGNIWENRYEGGDDMYLTFATTDAVYGNIWIAPDYAWYSFKYDINRRIFEILNFLTSDRQFNHDV